MTGPDKVLLKKSCRCHRNANSPVNSLAAEADTVNSKGRGSGAGQAEVQLVH